MFKSFYTFLFFLFITVQANAQNTFVLSGQITDGDGKAVPYTSIYIQKIAKGTMANIDGVFGLRLEAGSYEVTFQSLGFQTQKQLIVIQEDVEITIRMLPVAYELNEVEIDPSSEDPAYNIIRKAVVMSQYYKKQIAAYSARLYVRSFYEVKDIPWIAKKIAEEDELAEFTSGNIKESIVEYSYERPNKVKERIIAAKSGDRDTSKSGSSFINLSFYNLGGGEIINPLDRSSFAVYEFEYLNTLFEGAQKIHRIKIIPKRRGSDLMKGEIYINDQLWNINKVNVQFKQPTAELDYIQTYREVEPLVWMPINHNIKADIQLLGLDMSIEYLATLDSLEVKADENINQLIRDNLKLNDFDLPIDSSSVQEAVKSKAKTKTEEKIQALIQKEKLTKGETMKLVRLVKKQQETYEDTASKSFELNYNYKIEYADSAFSNNDSLWKAEREIPLSENEKQVYARRDSLYKVQRGDTVVNKEQKLYEKLLFFNGRVNTENKNVFFRPNGLLAELDAHFNTVDGFKIEKTFFDYERNNREGQFFKITPILRYAWSRETFMGQIDFESQYHKKSGAGFYASIGRNTIDFNRSKATSAFNNSLASVFFKKNYWKLYQMDFIRLGHQFDLNNYFNLDVNFNLEDRIPMQNNSDYDWSPSDRAYTPNIPINTNVLTEPSLISANQAFIIQTSLRYTKEQYYRYVRGKKIKRDPKTAVYELSYKTGLPNVLEATADFSLLTFSIQQSKRIGIIDKVAYKVKAGKFLNRNTLNFADYHAFDVNPFYFTSGNQDYSFALTGYHQYNSNDYFIQSNLAVEDNVLLLKNLPLFDRLNWSEQIGASYLYTEQEQHYSEINYSLKGILLLFNAGVYSSFLDGEYQESGIRIGVLLE